MERQADRQRHCDLSLRVLQGIVNLHRVTIGIHLGVGGGKVATGAVIVHDEIVNAADVWIFQHLALQLLNKLAIRALPEQRIDRVAHHLDASDDNQQRNDDAGDSVRGERGDAVEEDRNQHHGGGQDVAQAVESGRLKYRRIDLPPEGAVEEKHPEFHRYGERDRHHAPEGDLGVNRVKNPLRRSLEEIESDGDDDDRDHQPGHIFQPPVPEGVFVVSRFGGQFEAQQRHHRRAGVGEVVDRVGHDGNTAGDQPYRQFCGKEPDVADDAHRAGQFAVAFPNRRIINLFRLFDEKPDQQLRQHDISPLRIKNSGSYPADRRKRRNGSCRRGYSTTTATLIPFI